ncbi:MAG: acyl carrier protein [Oscillospiraceae bacterium]|nr:acyl carrier protein [Oscillospiraceae bacterium]
MDELLEILLDIDPDVDYETAEDLIDGKLLNSLSILQLIAEICDHFDIEISPKWMRNENFNSARRIWEMIQAIQEED